jgi:hypothetical protein
MQHRFTLLVIILVAGLSCATAETPSAPDTYVYLISPGNGEVVTSPVIVKFGLRGMGIAPAGAEIKDTGHHHLLIDVENLPDLNKPVPADEHHMHFGKGQTEVQLALTPGKHTLQLLLADFVHIPHVPVIKSEPITIYVTE